MQTFYISTSTAIPGLYNFRFLANVKCETYIVQILSHNTALNKIYSFKNDFLVVILLSGNLVEISVHNYILHFSVKYNIQFKHYKIFIPHTLSIPIFNLLFQFFTLSNNQYTEFLQHKTMASYH